MREVLIAVSQISGQGVDQGCEQRPEQGNGAVMARLLGDHEHDLAGGVVLHVADRLGEARLILG